MYTLAAGVDFVTLRSTQMSLINWSSGLFLLMGCVGAATADTGIRGAPVIDNERVTVWDVKLPKGATSPATPRDLDTVIMFIEGGQIRSARADGKSRTETRSFGDAVFVPKGSEMRDTLLSDGTAHEVVIALKDFHATPYVNTSGYPAAFPRPNSVKVFENDRGRGLAIFMDT